MDFAMGGAGGSDEQDSHKGRKSYHRHSSFQIQQLEAFFKECPHPDEGQRRQLGRELGLEPRQIKFWFQNKRTQTKAQCERADNTVLRAENERMLCENLAIREALKNVICPSCGVSSFGDEGRELSLQKLRLEHVQLKEEHERVSNLLAKYIEKPISQLESLSPTLGSPVDLYPGSSLNQGFQSPSLDLDSGSNLAISNDGILVYPTRGITDMEKALMSDTATRAVEELIRLLCVDEPLWVKSAVGEKFVLHRDSYEKIYPRANHFKSPSARVESSKDSRIVSMSGMQLVEMFLDSDEWVDVFPTIVTKAQTVQVLESGLLGNRTGALQLMYEEMHILSPLVPSRAFFFLRYCQQLETGAWVIGDVSFDYLKETTSLSHSWRLPSGCMIQELPNGSSKVTWVEHVEVDDKTQTHRLYRDLVCGNTAYGAERWVVTLHRMCERFVYSSSENLSSDEGGVITLPEGRRSILNLAHQMVKNFCGTLNMSGKLDFPQLSEVNNSGVRVSVRKNLEPGQPEGLIVTAATSLWLPLPPENVFEFFRDVKNRFKWDVLSYGNPVHEMAHISTGAHPGNCVSIIRPFIPTENNVLILQETCIDPLGSLVVYAPVDIPAINLAIRGEDSSMVPILPSGFIISGDGRPNTVAGASSSAYVVRSGGSLLTVAFQILICSPSAIRQMSMESVASVNTLISSTVQKIKEALNCSGLD